MDVETTPASLRCAPLNPGLKPGAGNNSEGVNGADWLMTDIGGLHQCAGVVDSGLNFYEHSYFEKPPSGFVSPVAPITKYFYRAPGRAAWMCE